MRCFGRRARFSRIGVHLEVLKPGRRTSWPHAERDEEEFVYVVSGKVDAWNDGHITPMGEGDFIGWEAGTGITHVIINNSDEDAILIVGGEAAPQAQPVLVSLPSQAQQGCRRALLGRSSQGEARAP